MFNKFKMMMAVALGRMLGTTPVSLHKAAMEHNHTVDALRASESTAPPLNRPRGIRSYVKDWADRLIPTRRVDRSKMHWGPNGAQAMARRVRQIQRFQLTFSNGLLIRSKRAPTNVYAATAGR